MTDLAVMDGTNRPSWTLVWLIAACASLSGCQGGPETTPTATMQIGGKAVPAGDPTACEHLATAANGRLPLAVGRSARGAVTALRLVDGPDDCTFDVRATARTLVVIGAGAGLVSPQQRAVVWEETGTLDLSSIEAQLIAAPDLDTVIRDPRRREALLRTVTTTVATLPMASPRVLPDPLGFDGLTFGTAFRENEFVTLTVSANEGAAWYDPAFEIKSILVDGRRQALIRGRDLFDVWNIFRATDHSNWQATLSIPIGTERVREIRVIAPSVGDVGATLSLSELAEGFHVDQRSLAAYGLQALMFTAPDFFGSEFPGAGPCERAIADAIWDLADTATRGYHAGENLVQVLKELVKEGRGVLPEIADVVNDCVVDVNWRDIVEFWNFFDDVLERGQFASKMLSAFLAGPQLAVHQLDLCSACPGAEQSVPDCLVTTGQLNCKPMCTVGTSETVACGNCGVQTRTCIAGTWSDYSACSSEGECSAGATETCGNGGMRTCTTVCMWNSCAGETPAAPATPTNVAATYQSANARNYVTWSAVSGATQYKVYWGTSPGVTTSSNVSGPTSTTDFGHTGVVAGTTYYYRVAALNAGGQSALSLEVSATVPTSQPNLVVGSVTGSSPVGRGVFYSVSARVDRTGGLLVNGSYVLVRVYLSSDPMITTSDYQCSVDSDGSSQFSNATLNSLGTLTKNVGCVPPSGMPAGSYYWGAIVDPTGFHAESIESDNARSGSSVVVQ